MIKMGNIQHLGELIKKDKVILFVGAGVSAHLGLPNWDQLIEKMAVDLELNPEEFKSYGDFLLLAEYYKIMKEKDITSLVKWLSEKCDVPKDALKQSKIFSAIARLKFKKIYTTNYDKLLEHSLHLNGYHPITIKTISDLNKEVNDVQVIKFHGDIKSPKTIVLTESDYFSRLNFESPLDIKFRSDIIGKSILFIGYSMNDINIRYLIYKLNELWDHSEEKKKEKNYIFLAKQNKVKETIFNSKAIIPIVGEGDDEASNLLDFLNSLLAEVDK